jgi:hypothetical protein
MYKNVGIFGFLDIEDFSSLGPCRVINSSFFLPAPQMGLISNYRKMSTLSNTVGKVIFVVKCNKVWTNNRFVRVRFVRVRFVRVIVSFVSCRASCDDVPPPALELFQPEPTTTATMSALTVKAENGKSSFVSN